MGVPKDRAIPVGLSLVVDNSPVRERSANRGAKSGQTILQGWFEEEVGYVGVRASALQVVSDSNASEWDGHD
ncbi:hypothetical protein RI103_30710 [Paraburkholderia sp. FT54]|uniref:hypothetical protein n=1 Tax=Paraburkholderia sp. FT54 TaxID=3074437 RepID=UPI002877CB81|nr:hypothetical protein [Paraburkholderia sp. FT54]WNC92619.1 hypothetical protein RI103_30710 [Paraburkholderia sp. FT54]